MPDLSELNPMTVFSDQVSESDTLHFYSNPFGRCSGNITGLQYCYECSEDDSERSRSRRSRSSTGSRSSLDVTGVFSLLVLRYNGQDYTVVMSLSNQMGKCQDCAGSTCCANVSP